MNTKAPDGPSEKSNVPRMTWRLPVYQLALMLGLIWFWHNVAHHTDRHPISYSEFKAHLTRGEVKEVAISEIELIGRIVTSVVGTNVSPAATNTSKSVPNATVPEPPSSSGAVTPANTLNEAAMLAARRHAATIAQHDLENAIEKVVAGPERKGHRLNAEQRRRVAFHEVGHALIAAQSKGADPVHKVSIVPRGRAALGYTMQLPTEEQFLLTSNELKARIRGLLGGRAAEEIIFSEMTTGAQNDLERATALARQMVCMFGMSEKLGLAHVVQRPLSFLGVGEHGTQRDCSEATAREIDEEVKAILDLCCTEAKEVLELHRDQLDCVRAALLKSETLNAAAFYALIKRSESKQNAAQASTRESRVEAGAELSLT